MYTVEHKPIHDCQRICPGEHFATNFVVSIPINLHLEFLDELVFIKALNTMMLLWAFKFGPGATTKGGGYPLDLCNYATVR